MKCCGSIVESAYCPNCGKKNKQKGPEVIAAIIKYFESKHKVLKEDIQTREKRGPGYLGKSVHEIKIIQSKERLELFNTWILGLKEASEKLEINK